MTRTADGVRVLRLRSLLRAAAPQLVLVLLAVSCLPARSTTTPPAPTAEIPPPVPAAGRGFVAPLASAELPAQRPAEAAPPAQVDGRLLVASTRSGSRPRSDLGPDYRLAWWSRAGQQPVRVPGDDAGVAAAAVRPGGGAVAVIVGGTRLLVVDEEGHGGADLVPRLSGAQPLDVQTYLSVSWAGRDRVLVRQTAPAGLFLVDASGQSRVPLPLIGPDPMASPDGRSVALAYAAGRSYLSVFVAADPFDQPTKLTSDDVIESHPAWSPDGAWIAYAARAGQPLAWEVRTVRADGSQRQTVIRAPPGIAISSLIWSPDGTRVGFTRYDEAAHTRQIVIVKRDGSDEVAVSDRDANDRLLDWVK